MRTLLSLPLLLIACDPAETVPTDDPYDGEGTTACWQAEAALDLTDAPGAGDGYAKPSFNVTCGSDTVTLRSNGMPSYTFVALTPNALVEQSLEVVIPRFPAVADTPTDIPLLGYAGLNVAGLSWFGPNEGAIPAESAWGDPVYNGIVDGCFGHTANEYHHHALAEKCLTQDAVSSATPWTAADPDASSPSPILGYAADGFPIYGPRGCLDEDCTDVVTFQSGWVATADPVQDAWDNHAYQGDPDDETVLDQCNGRIGPDGTYRYHATATFPYILGCFAGTPMGTGDGAVGDAMGGGDDGAAMGGPSACNPDGSCDEVGTVCATTPQGDRCVPSCSQPSDCPAGMNGDVLTCSSEGACVPG